MEELELKSQPLQPRWYTTEESETLRSGGNRWRNGIRSHIWRPPTDVFETEEAIVISGQDSLRPDAAGISSAGACPPQGVRGRPES